MKATVLGRSMRVLDIFGTFRHRRESIFLPITGCQKQTWKAVNKTLALEKRYDRLPTIQYFYL